ncbi:MAG: AMP-binding protein [Desulfobacteraceae bacterium]|nr:AMP-binding protein [Desulfobacteraceae bacterium]MBC2755521.1 AMP-binding protein [Desulfobacteraceae bacterium]
MGLYDFTFYDLIQRNAAAFSRSMAWYEVDDRLSLTFGDVKNRVDLIAGGLKAAGIEKGDRLGVLGKNSIEYFLLYGAAAAVGAIILPVNWRLNADEICYILNDCTPRFLFADEEFQDMITSRRPDLPSIEKYYNLKGDSGSLDAFTSLLDADEMIETPGVNSDDGFVIIHTAAVAGRPRGALLSHANMLCACLHLDYYFALSEKDVHLSLLPLFHVGGLFMAVSAFQAGALNVNISRFDADKAVGLIEEFGVSLFFDFPPILASILKAAGEKKCSLPTLRSVVGLGTPEDIDRYQKMTSGTYYCIYGQTETAMLATMGRYNDAPGSAGKPVILADVRTVDDDDRLLPPGEPGEIVMKGPLVFKGYWNLPEDNSHTFRGGWHHTGDMGRFDENGFLFYAGRKPEKELIKPGGENVYPAEVEKIILQHPAVEKTAVIGVPDPKWKEGIKAVCQLKAGESLGNAELIAFVGDRIARYKKPHYVEIVSDLPLKPDGMPDREKIKKLYGQS